MNGTPMIFRLVHAIICARSSADGERAFAALCRKDLEAAEHLAIVLTAAVPSTAPLWRMILAEMEQTKKDEAKMIAGPPIAECDAADTATAFADHLGWRDMERRA